MNKRQRKKAKQKALLRLFEAKTTAAKEYFRSTFQNDALLLQKLMNEKETTFHPPYHLLWKEVEKD